MQSVLGGEARLKGWKCFLSLYSRSLSVFTIVFGQLWMRAAWGEASGGDVSCPGTACSSDGCGIRLPLLSLLLCAVTVKEENKEGGTEVRSPSGRYSSEMCSLSSSLPGDC